MKCKCIYNKSYGESSRVFIIGDMYDYDFYKLGGLAYYADNYDIFVVKNCEDIPCSFSQDRFDKWFIDVSKERDKKLKKLLDE